MVHLSRVQVVSPAGNVRQVIAPGERALAEASVGHATVLIGILLSMSLAVAVALLDDSPLGALELLLVVPVVTAVLSVAWMRPPSRSPEHHPAVDRLLDDTAP